MFEELNRRRQAVADLQKKIKKMSDGGEELKWENW